MPFSNTSAFVRLTVDFDEPVKHVLVGFTSLGQLVVHPIVYMGKGLEFSFNSKVNGIILACLPFAFVSHARTAGTAVDGTALTWRSAVSSIPLLQL